MVDDDAIRRGVFGRNEHVETDVDWGLTPTGKRRSSPTYSATVRNTFLSKTRTLKASDAQSLEQKARELLRSWAEEEFRLRVREATRDAKDAARSAAEDADEAARAALEAIRGILVATLNVDDRLPWDSLFDRRTFGSFSFRVPPPQPPSELAPLLLAPKPFWSWLIPSLGANWQTRCDALVAQRLAAVQEANGRHEAAEFVNASETAVTSNL